MAKKKPKKKGESDKDKEDSNIKEYGVVLKKDAKLRHRIYPQKGKVPEKEDTDSYKIV